MSLFEITAYKCEWCGRLFETKNYCHSIECNRDPGQRTCPSCVYATKFKRPPSSLQSTIVYCPRVDEMFAYPHDSYCREYKKEPTYKSYRGDDQ